MWAHSYKIDDPHTQAWVATGLLITVVIIVMVMIALLCFKCAKLKSNFYLEDNSETKTPVQSENIDSTRIIITLNEFSIDNA